MEVPMHRPFALAVCALAAFALFAIAPAHAEGLAKGSSILSFQATTGTADLTTGRGGGRITAYDHSEWGGQVSFQHLMSDDWAIALSGGIGTFKETDEPGNSSPPLTTDFVYKQSSWQARIGADRFVHISPSFHLFVGPGLQYWSGKAKSEDAGVETETVRTKRFAFNGRMGAHVALSDGVALIGHLGHYLGHASATSDGAKASWMPSGTESAVGFAYKFSPRNGSPGGRGGTTSAPAAFSYEPAGRTPLGCYTGTVGFVISFTRGGRSAPAPLASEVSGCPCR
jgi:hypothetical protein